MAGKSRISLIAAVAIAVSLCATTVLRAQTLIRDAEIEYSLRELARPILNAAGLSPDRVQILVLKDDDLNAFIVDTRHIFINSGLIRRMDNAAMLQAVIAHEAAHIANGHITRRFANMRSARTAAGLGALLSAAVAASGNSRAAAGVLAGSIGSSQRVLFSHTRSEENSADQSGARFMSQAGVDPQAMVEVLEIFRGQEALSTSRQDPYARTHPLSRDRLRAARGYAAAYAPQRAPDEGTEYWFQRARGKLEAFIGNPQRTLRRLRRADASSLVLMQRAVAYHRIPDAAKAVQTVNALVGARPNDPYAHELRGQILFESRQFGAAVNAYAQAVNLSPNQPLILAGYGRALLALDTGDGNRRALQVLERARSRDPQQPRMLRDLAVAYAKNGNNGMASLATAERYALLGRMDDAEVHATRASGLLPRGNPGWTRAQDVLLAAQAAANQRR